MACKGCGGDYYEGDSVDVEAIYQDAVTGALLDMDTVLMYATPPTGPSVLLSTSHPSLGTYTASFVASAAGHWLGVSVGTLGGKVRVLRTPLRVLVSPIV